MSVTKTDEIELNSQKYKIKGQVRGSFIDPFPESIAIGDADYANRRDLSSWIMDFTGGIGDEQFRSAPRSWWTNCITQYPKHILPPRLATALTPPTANPTAPTIVNADMELTTGWDTNYRNSNQAHGGTYSWQLVHATSIESYQDLTGYVAGCAYTFSCWAWEAGSDASGQARIGINDGVTTTYSAAKFTADWTQLSVSKTLAVNATRLRVILEVNDGGGAGSALGYFDDATITSDTTMTVGASFIMQNFNGNLYATYGRVLVKLNAGRTAFTAVAYLASAPIALIASLNSRLYIYMGDSTNYYYMSTAEAFTQSNSADAYWAFQYDAKLFKANSSGTVAYSTDPDGGAPTWTSGGAITDIADQIEGFFVGRDASGTITPYAATNSILKAYDASTPQWVDTEAKLPNHPIGGKGHAYFNGKNYLSYGLGMKEYYPETGAFVDVGLTTRDGLPIEYNGEIVKLYGDSGFQGMFAAIDASQPSGNSLSGLYLFDGGWQCWWTPPTILIEDAEDAWNELVDADVTASLDTTDFQVGAGSAKFVCAANLAAGDIIATEAISSKDLSGKSHITLRIKSTVALSAGDLQILLDNTASCASPLESLDIPAVDANTWTKVDIALAAASSDTAIISVGLKMIVDKGAFTVNIDQIEGVYYNGAMYDIIVSSASSGYAVYFDHAATISYIDIPRGVENPDKISQSYAAAGILITPWFDANNQTAAKLAKLLSDFAKGITTTETVALKYRIDHTYTDLDSGWTTLDTLNTTGESGYNEELFASGAGVSFKSIQFRLDFVTLGSTAKPDIQSLVLYYAKRTGSVKIRQWLVTVVVDQYQLTTGKQQVANLASAITSATDVLFSYHPNDASTESFYVNVDCPEFLESTGRDYEANYTLKLTER